MLGCTNLVNGVPDPIPPRPIFIYLDKNGRPVPPPNYIPNLNDCLAAGCGCGCGCSGSGTSTTNPSPLTSSCGGSCGGGTPAIGMTACSGDPGAKQLEAVNELLRKASQDIVETSRPGFLEVWDGSTGNLLRQYAVPTVDALAPTPVFTYNSLASVANSPFGNGWVMLFLQSVNGSTTSGSSAVVTKGTGTSFTYTNRNAGTGVYTAPPNAINKLVGNANGTWTETQPDGLMLNYNSSGKLATLKRASDTWTLTYNAQQQVASIKDPVNRLASFVYQGITMGTLRRFVDVVGRITTFSYAGSPGPLHTITYPTLQVTTITGFPITLWLDPVGNRTTYTYQSGISGSQLATVKDPTGHLTTVTYPALSMAGYQNANGSRFTYTYTAAGQPRAVVNPLAQRITLTWTAGMLTALQDTAGHRTTLSYASMSDGRKLVGGLQTPTGDRYTWLYL